MSMFKAILIPLGLAGALAAVQPAAADHNSRTSTYEVTITNLTRGQSFTPIVVATHRSGLRFFNVGTEAGDGLAALAEGGDIGPLSDEILASGKVSDIEDSSGQLGDTGGLLNPGKSVTVTVTADRRARSFSLAAMLIPTNDAFLSITNVALPRGRDPLVVRGSAYDAGSEPNDEVCANIPGPVCGGAGGSPDAGGEGFVHIHAGIHGIADLVAADRDWRNQVVQVVVRRVSRY